MFQSKRLRIALLAIAGMLIILAIGTILILPRLIDTDQTKDMVLREIEQRTGVQADYRSAQTRFFPFLSFTLFDGTLKAPGGIQAVFQTMKISPRLLSLLMGQLRISEIEIESPRVIATLPSPAPDSSSDSAPPAPSLPPGIPVPRSILAPIIASEMAVAVKGGSIDVEREGKMLWRISDIDWKASSASNRVEIRLTCTSSLWKALSLRGSFDARDLKTRVDIAFEALQPDKLLAIASPKQDLTLGESSISLTSSIEADGEGRLRMTFGGSLAALALQKGDSQFIVRGDNIEGNLLLDSRKVELQLAKSSFTSPKINLTGLLAREFDNQMVSLELNGKNVDAGDARRFALLIAGQHNTVQKIFEIIRGGEVPQIQFTSHGRTMRDLPKPENFVIKGSMAGGSILVPKCLLEVEDATGEVIVSKAVLEGRNLAGRSGGSTGLNGSLTVGLKKNIYGDAPFKLDIELDADLAQLPTVLERVVPSEGFLHEISLISEISGRAKGRLVLGENLKSVKTMVDVPEFNASGQYKRIPYPFNVRGKGFLLEGDLVRVGSLSGALGKSLLADVAGSIDWERESTLKIGVSSRCDVVLEEVYAWLVSYEHLRTILKNLDALKGIVHIESFNLDGPTRRAREWRFTGRGTVENFLMGSTYTPEPFQVKTGTVEADETQLTAKDCTATFLDSTLLVSGTLTDLWSELRASDLSLSGKVHPRFNEWIMSLIPNAKDFTLRPSYEVTGGKFRWEKDQRIAFSGSIAGKEGTILELEAENTPRELTLRRVRVTDGKNRVDGSFKFAERILQIGYGGVLEGNSLDKLMAKSPVVSGSLRGDFEARIPFDRLSSSEIRGDLQVAGFQISTSHLKSLVIESLAVKGEGKSFVLQDGTVSWNDVKGQLRGRIDLSGGAYDLDLDILADMLNWEEMTRVEEKQDKANESTREAKESQAKILGTVRVKADAFSHGTTRWEPFQAQVHFNQEGYAVEVMESRLCGIPMKGSLKVSGQEVDLAATPSAKKENLESTLACLWNWKDLVTGSYDLRGDLAAKGTRELLTVDGLRKSVKGNLELDTRGGRIQRFGLLSKVLSMLNLTEIYRGKLPDLGREGFEYDSIKARGDLAEGKLRLEEFTISAPSMKMFWQGDVDLTKNEVNLTLLIAPLRTIDKVIDSVPLVGDILGGSLVSIPVQVTGDWNDPTVIPLSPSAIGSKLIGHVKRAFQLPLKMIQPFQGGSNPKPQDAPPATPDPR